MVVDWMLCIYALGALLVGVLIFRDDLGLSFVKKEGERLGPSYWGVYQGNPVDDTANEKIITPPKPCQDEDVVVGSGAYSGGKAVHTAKS